MVSNLPGPALRTATVQNETTLTSAAGGAVLGLLALACGGCLEAGQRARVSGVGSAGIGDTGGVHARQAVCTGLRNHGGLVGGAPAAVVAQRGAETWRRRHVRRAARAAFVREMAERRVTHSSGQ
eukprot:356533-Chlamydomonas_euryale.AAC.5